MATTDRHILTSSPRHIVHLSYTLVRPKYTSPERWLERVAFISGVPEKLVPFGKQVVIYNIHYKGEIERNGVQYIFPGFKRWQLVFPFAYNRMIRDLKPGVVLVHGLIFPWQIIMLRNLVGPHVRIICQHHAERPFKDFRKYLFRWADKYVGAYFFAARAHGEEWVKAKQISSMSKVHEIMGMSSMFLPGNVGGSLSGGPRQTDKKTYLWIGDLNENKDPLLTANAFRKFAQEHDDVTLYMIFQTNALENELRSIGETTPSIHLVGKVEHAKLQEWFNNADFIISSSHYESAGIAVCEALSCGCVPILTNIPSFRMMTGNGTIGKLFEAGDETGLIDALQQSYNMDLESGAKKVIDHFQKELSFEANARKIMNVVNQL